MTNLFDEGIQQIEFYSMRRFTHRHRLEIVLVALTQFTGDHRLGFAHVVDRTLDRDNALEIEAIYVIDAADGDFRIRVLHYSLDRVTALADYTADQIVVREDLQRYLTVTIIHHCHTYLLTSLT